MDGQGEGRSGFSTRLRLALGMAAFGSATPISKIVTGALPVFIGSGLRVAIGALVLLPFAFRRRAEIAELDRREWLIVGAISLFGMFGFSVFMLYGMRLVSGVVGAIVMSTAPAVTAAASMLFMGDAPNRRKLLAVALAVAGVLVLHLGRTGDDGGSLLLGGAMIFGAVCCEACYTLFGKKLSQDRDPLLIAFLAAALSLPLFLPLALWQIASVDWNAITIGAWLAVIWYGAGTLALGSWLWYSGLVGAEGSVAAAFMGVMPASALVLSYVLLGEAFEWLHLLGFAVVFSSVLLISLEHARMGRDG